MIDRAKVNVVLVAVNEWQRGAITWFECLRRCDLSNSEAQRLKQGLYSLMTCKQASQAIALALNIEGKVQR